MNRGRAETFLRLMAEAELRHETTHPRDSALLPPDVPGSGHDFAALLRQSAVAAMLCALLARQREAITLQYHAGLSEAETAATMRISRGAVKAHTARGISMLRAARETRYARVSRVAQVLTGVGALDEEVADQVLDDFQLALASRQAGSGGQRMGWLARSASARRRPAWMPAALTHPPGWAGPQVAPGRVVPLGQRLAVRGADVTVELYLLSYARTACGPQFSVFARTRGQSGRWESARPHLFVPFTATDDRGTTYQAGIRDISSGPMGWTLMLRPDPPHEPRWLDLTTTPGAPAVRIDLGPTAPGTRLPGAADVTVRNAALSPGEHLLHTIAAQLLAAAWPAAARTTTVDLGRRHPDIFFRGVSAALAPYSGSCKGQTRLPRETGHERNIRRHSLAFIGRALAKDTGPETTLPCSTRPSGTYRRPKREVAYYVQPSTTGPLESQPQTSSRPKAVHSNRPMKLTLQPNSIKDGRIV
ncbi:MAG: RNA polymerase sigma factor [Streptosporangiaceae bacterium]